MHPLPPLPAWHARSFYAAILLLATVICNAGGVDLHALLGRLGLGVTDDRVLDSVMQLAPLAFGVWAWLERRAPNYRLVIAPGLRMRAWLARLRARLRKVWTWFWRWS